MSAALEVPPLHTRQIQLWWARPSQIAPTAVTVLDGPERTRLRTLPRPPDRRRFVTAAWLLRQVSAEHTGTSPERLHVVRHCPDCTRPHGRPLLPGTGLHVSLSHAGDRVLLAVTRLGEVGADVEHVPASDDVAEMAGVVLTDDEPLPADPGTRIEAFYRYWTRKESLVKATGEGLRVPLRDVVVSPYDAPARLLRWGGIDPRSFLVIDVDAGPGYQAAISLRGAGPAALSVHHVDAPAGTPAGTPAQHVSAA